MRCGCAWAHSKESILRSMNHSVRAMEAAHERSDRLAYARADSAFHGAFFEHCGSRHLVDAYETVRGRISAIQTHPSVPQEAGLVPSQNSLVLTGLFIKLGLDDIGVIVRDCSGKMCAGGRLIAERPRRPIPTSEKTARAPVGPSMLESLPLEVEFDIAAAR